MAVGFCRVDVLLFPKFHSQETGLPVDKSWKLIIIGEQPETGEPLKFAMGACPKALPRLKIKACNTISFERILRLSGFKKANFCFLNSIPLQKLFPND